MSKDPVSLNGIDFIEYASPEPRLLEKLFLNLGFKKTGVHKTKSISLFQQGYCQFILNEQANSFAEDFSKEHGPSVCALGFRVKDAMQAFEWTCSQGAKAVEKDNLSHSFPAIYGVGGSVIYFIDHYGQKDSHFKNEFEWNPIDPKNSELINIDHLTHNVPSGEMDVWCDFYRNVFGFSQIRYFDIKGLKTGLLSKVMQSSNGSVIIPINEPAEGEKGKKSQIQEYLDEYKGSGIQHIAFITKDIVSSIKNLKNKGLEFLDVPETYYDSLKKRIPLLEEDINELKNLRILSDGDDKGYLLQIFTQNVIGPIFYEVIQRKNHQGFGEGNFQALFDSIERDQIKRGYINS